MSGHTKIGPNIPASDISALVTKSVSLYEYVLPNLAPFTVDDYASTSTDTPIEIDILANDSDTDGTIDITSVVVETQPTNGSASVNPTGTITYTPNTGFSGNDSFTYTVSDDLGKRSSPASVNVAVSSTQNTSNIGGIPAGTGTGTYAHSGVLQDFTPALVNGSPYYHHILSGANDSFILQDKKITSVTGAAAYAVSGTSGDNQTITIEGNKFQNMGSRALFVKNVDNVIIQGNMYDNVRTCIHIYNVKNLTILAEKIKNNASGWGYNTYLNGHVISVNDSILDSLLVKGVLVDRSDAPYAGLDLSDGSADRNDAALASDYINFRTTHMASGKIGYIENSMISGSENIGEAQSGAGFIADHDCSGLVFRKLVGFNCTESIISSANSSTTFEDIIGCYTQKANQNLTYPASNDSTAYTYGKISRNTVFGVASQWYSGHSCDAADGQSGPTSFTRVRVVGYRADDLSAYYGGYISSEAAGRVVPNSTWFNITDCNFGISTAGTTEDAGKCGIDPVYRMRTQGDEGTASLPTPDEVCQIMFGMNYTPGMATNGAMFAKWGTASNHEMYFDESRSNTYRDIAYDLTAPLQPGTGANSGYYMVLNTENSAYDGRVVNWPSQTQPDGPTLLAAYQADGSLPDEYAIDFGTNLAANSPTNLMIPYNDDTSGYDWCYIEYHGNGTADVQYGHQIAGDPDNTTPTSSDTGVMFSPAVFGHIIHENPDLPFLHPTCAMTSVSGITEGETRNITISFPFVPIFDPSGTPRAMTASDISVSSSMSLGTFAIVGWSADGMYKVSADVTANTAGTVQSISVLGTTGQYTDQYGNPSNADVVETFDVASSASPNLIVNSTFDTDYSPLTAYDDIIPSIDNGRLYLDNTSNSSWARMSGESADYTTDTVTPGATYTLSADIEDDTLVTNGAKIVLFSVAQDNTMTSVSNVFPGTPSNTFILPQDCVRYSMWFIVQAGSSAWFDNVTLTKGV